MAAAEFTPMAAWDAAEFKKNGAFYVQMCKYQILVHQLERAERDIKVTLGLDPAHPLAFGIPPGMMHLITARMRQTEDSIDTAFWQLDKRITATGVEYDEAEDLMFAEDLTDEWATDDDLADWCGDEVAGRLGDAEARVTAKVDEALNMLDIMGQYIVS